MKEKKDIIWRAYIVYLGFFVALVVVIVKTALIQTEGSVSVFSDAKEKIKTKTEERYPRRGEILDRNFTPLLTSVSFFDLRMDPTVVDEEVFNRDISDLCIGLNKLFPETSARDFESFIRSGRARNNRYVKIKLGATNAQRNLAKKLPIFELGRNKGGLIDDEERMKRKRPHGMLLERTLGYYNDEDTSDIVRVGIEGAYNDILSGEPGLEIMQNISSGWKKTGKFVKEPVEGADLITSFDLDIQEVAHSELLQQLKTQGAKSGCAIVMDVKTGFVRAMVNLQLDKKGNYSEVYNQAIGSKEVPGSTFKLASLMAALEDKKIRLSDIVDANGIYNFGPKLELHDSNKFGYGKITIRKAFEVSSNVIAKVIQNAYRNEPQAFIDRLRSFGLADSLGVELLGEPKPTLYAPGMPQWSGISLPWMAIGYEVQQTPLQTLAFYNAVANDGDMVRPQFVEQIRRGNAVVKKFQPIYLRKNICSKSTLTQLQECLEGVVIRGTGSALKSSLFDIAGKTGTAKILNDQNSYGEEGQGRYQASFVGYFPAKDPIYSCIVVVSAPTRDIYGATVSGTVFTAIANKVYSNTLSYHHAINASKPKREVPKAKPGRNQDLIRVMKDLKMPYTVPAYSEWSKTKSDGKKMEIAPMQYSKNNVPNVRGLLAKDAVYLIEKQGMHVLLRGKGRVVSQTIPAGTPVYKGGLIELVLE